MSLVFDFRLCQFVWEFRDYYIDSNIIIILLILSNAFSYLLVGPIVFFILKLLQSPT